MAFESKRLRLQEILTDLLGSEHVYYQPPESLRLSYPCVVYSRQTGDSQYADNMNYKFFYRYQIIYIDRDPDSDFPAKMLKRFPMCVYDNHYVADNLNHEVFNLYF